MKLSDIMGAANLAIYAEVALLIFFVIFLLIVRRVVGGKQDYGRARMLPFDDARREENDGHD